MDKPAEQTMKVDEAVAKLVHDLPAPIREFVMGPERDRISLALTQKYSLHADQGGTFGQAYLYLLLGITSPEEFAAGLKAAGISDETVAGLTNDINEQVFKPLRAKIQQETPSAGPAAAAAPIVSTPPLSASSTIPPPPVPAPILAAPKPIPPTSTLAPVAPSPAPKASVSAPAPLSSIPAHPDHPVVRTMAADMQAAKEHHLPEPFFSKPAPIRAAPLPVAAPITPPVVIPPPITPLPSTSSIVLPPLPPFPRAADDAPTPRTAPPPANLPGTPAAPPYGIDPYHEPLE